MKKFINNNKGLSLLEMIISVAILGIIFVTATSFMVTGVKMFGASNNEVELQQDVQIALSNVENRIIDAKMGVRCDDDGTQVILTVFNEQSGIAPKEYIVWNRNDNKIYYDTSAADVTKTTFATNEVLAENVTNFQLFLKDGVVSVTVTPEPTVSVMPNPSVTEQPASKGGKKNPKVEIAIEVQDNGRKHSSQKVVTFRNQITVSANGDKLYTDTRNGLDSKAEEVKITPQDVYLLPGQSYQFHARVLGVGYPSQMVTWSVDGEGVTITESGKVTVQPNAETSSVVNVNAVAGKNSEGETPSGSAKLHICKIEGISVTTDVTKVYAGSMLKVKANVSGTNLNDEMKKVTFSVKESNLDWVSLYSNSGVFGLNKEARGKTFTVVATSVHNPEISGELKIKVEDTALSDLGTETVIANRDSRTELLTNVAGENLAESELRIEWDIADYGGLSDDKVSVGKHNGILDVKKDINYENEYHLKIAATISAERLPEPVTTYVAVIIPKVSVHFLSGEGGTDIKKNGTVLLPYEVIGLDGAKTEILATTNPSVRNSIIYVTEEGVRLSIGDDVKSDKICVIATIKNTNTSDTINVTVK